MDENNLSMFKITGRKGFQMTFANGFTASVQFGIYNYCERFTIDKYKEDEGNISSRDAEVACRSANGNLIYLSDYDKEISDQVIGYLTTNEVLDFMNWVASLPPDYVDK